MGEERERDVIIVGAGPSGAATATILAQKGYDVLLLDRFDFPRDKACGDGIPAGAIEIMNRLGMKKKIEKAIERGEFYRVDSVRILSPRGKMLQASLNEGKEGGRSYVAPRMYFDAVLQEQAVESGAEFKKALVKEPLLENGRVVGVQAQLNGSVKPIRSKIVVGADGVTSAITRGLREERRQHVDLHRAVALRAYITDIEEIPREVEFYLYDEILPGYAWIFPAGEGKANIGLGMRLDVFRNGKHNLKSMLQEFLDLPQIKPRLKRGGEVNAVKIWQLNFGSQKKLQHAFDGALLVGDAAGFINPLTGGGIHNALISSSFAGQTIDEAFQKGDTSRDSLRIYEKRCNDEMWKGMRRSYFIQRWLLRFPGIADAFFSYAGEDGQLAKIFLEKL
ncbi:MAG: NAD(P)/FAD-dependent oxidoreductase [Candidatus Promineifilaceae bacterium]|nr:NAD(P)/FAD-dependent oxidoreductase [Candidatus Promineifilaceae bacterium]